MPVATLAEWWTALLPVLSLTVDARTPAPVGTAAVGIAALGELTALTLAVAPVGYLSAAAAAGLVEEQLWAAAAGAGLGGAAPPAVSLAAPQSAALSLTAWTQTGGDVRVEPDAPVIAAVLRGEGADVPAACVGAFAFNVTGVSTEGVAVAAQRLLARVSLPRGRLSPSAISAVV